MDFFGKDLVSYADLGDILPDTGAHQMVLNPAVGPLDLAFGLRRERVDRLNPAIEDDLFPLRIDRIGCTLVLVDGVT